MNSVLSKCTLLTLGLLSSAAIAAAQAPPPLVLSPRLHHIRIDGPREWTEFPEHPESARLELKFSTEKNTSESTLALRQQDVKQRWHVRINDKSLGQLVVDENDQTLYVAVPANTLVDGDNTLVIAQDPGSRQPDDIRIGELILHPRPPAEILSEATVELEVIDTNTGEQVPARLTVLNERGALQSTSARSSDQLAVRAGIVYTADGRARFSLPAGKYTIHAGRGFEYSLDILNLHLEVGKSAKHAFKIHREVPTAGYVACDPHVHTFTHSRHGDATIEERMITLAAECVELPIAADHNQHVDFDPIARKLQLRRHFTPVIGNEVTTLVGHFNVFPVRAGARVPDHRATDWKTIFAEIYQTPDVKVVILNHARDLHSGVRPFGPKLHNAVVGRNLEGWALRANAMEVVNSGSVQTDVYQLFHDWMAMLNRGGFLTPIGASDSHDVARHFVGQGRTYIRARDANPGDINIDEAVTNLLQGRVMVCYGLLAELTVANRYGPGELAPIVGPTVPVRLRVLGPHWVQATEVRLYANGQLIREANIPAANGNRSRPPGVIWEESFDLPTPRHDVHLVAIASGPGIEGFYWKTAKPYQPTSPDWKSSVLGASGAVWLDIDGDGRPTPAFDYAQRIMATNPDNLSKLIASLAPYDAAVAAQAADLWQQSGKTLLTDESQAVVRSAVPHVQAGFQAYLDAWRENQQARSDSAP